MRVGQGCDIHRLVEGRDLILGGISIPFLKGEEAHSDGDVLIHAIIDSLFGAAALGDIGSHFPPSDGKLKNISSRTLLRETAGIVSAEGYTIINIDSTIILQEPRLAHYTEQMKNNLAEDLGISVASVSVKAKTAELTGPVGEGRAVEAFSICLIQQRTPGTA